MANEYALQASPCGTFGYMAPEVTARPFTDDPRLNTSSDVFALGVSLFELVFGHSIYEWPVMPEGATLNQQRAAHHALMQERLPAVDWKKLRPRPEMPEWDDGQFTMLRDLIEVRLSCACRSHDGGLCSHSHCQVAHDGAASVRC